MARIRTIKPDFFRNLKLFRAEVESKLPLRLSFAGLWTACDRDGRFKWCPEELKLDCLPYDDVNFSRVLDALLTRGYIVKYSVENEFFGCVPTWIKHQVINNRERASELPDVSMAQEVIDASSTREPRDTENSEGKGREGKGRGNGFARVDSKHKHGEYGHVSLSDKDLEKLKAGFPDSWSERIKSLDEGIEQFGYKYKNHYLSILSWARKEGVVPKGSEPVADPDAWREFDPLADRL